MCSVPVLVGLRIKLHIIFTILKDIERAIAQVTRIFCTQNLAQVAKFATSLGTDWPGSMQACFG